MRLIDADAFIVDSVKNKRFVFHTEDIINDAIIVETVYGDLLDAIRNMPTIDAVEVVRCKDCRWFAWYVKELAEQIGFDGVCNKAGCEMRKRTDYCSYGEPWEDAEVEG